LGFNFIQTPCSPAKASNAIEAGQKVDHCAAAMASCRIADAPTGPFIALTADFDCASGLLALTSSASGDRRSGLKQIERAYEGE